MTLASPTHTFPITEISAFLENMPFPVVYISQKLDILYYNESFSSFISKDIVHDGPLYIHDFMPEFQPNGLHSGKNLRKYMQERKNSFQTQWVLTGLDGEALMTKLTLAPASAQADSNFFLYIHHEQACQNCLKEANKTLEFINNTLNTMPLTMHIWSRDLHLIDCSDEVTRMFGAPSKEEYKKNYMNYSPAYQVDGLSNELMPEYLEKAFTDGAYKFQWIHQNHEGKTFPTEETFCRVTFQGEDFILGYTQDISAVTDSIKNIVHMEERTRAILDATPMAILLWDQNYILKDTNLEALRIYNYEDKYDFLQEFQNTLPELQPDGANSNTVIQNALEEAFEKGYYHMPKFFCRDIDGGELPVEVTIIRIVIRDETMVIAYLRDLREILQVLQTMQLHEERIQAILDAAPMAINLWDSNFTLRDTNLECLRLFGFDSKQDFKDNYFNIVPKPLEENLSVKEHIQRNLTQAFEKGYLHYESRLRHRNGEIIPLEVSLIRITLSNETMIIAYLRDLREIKNFIAKITESEARSQAILDLSPLGINVWDRDNNLVDCNKAIVHLFGFSSREEYIKNRHTVIPEKQEDGTLSHPLAQQKINEAFTHGQSHVEVVANDVHGNSIPLDVVIKRTVLGEQEVVIAYMRDLRELKAMLAEIHAVEQDLRSARDVAVQSASAKSEFLANMSHEIRTPLNGVLGLLHLLDKTPLEEMQQSYVDKTIFSAENLLRIINDILDFSKIDAGKLEMEIIPFALEDVAGELKMLFEPQANAKDLALTFKYTACTKYMLLGDPLRIKQVFFNLIGNAIKFTESGGITINMTGEEESPGKIHCLFSVQDSGIGMNEEQRTRLFSAFMQADTSVTRKYGGTGLGLVIAQRIARLMHGDLWVESVEGQGSTFFFSAIFDLAHAEDMTCAMMDQATEMVIPSHDETPLKNTTKSTCTYEQGAKSSAPCTEQVAQEGPSFHILLVEDNEINQLIAEELLKNGGHTVDIANNGQEALDLLEKNTYNIVLMDIQMPVLDGLSTVSKIRADARLAHMPVIAMSAHAMTGDREISLHHGMNEHITKPISPQVLYETVNTWALRFEKE